MSESIPSNTLFPQPQRQQGQEQLRTKTLEVPTPSSTRPSRPPNSVHLLPATALFHGPHSRNASYSSLNPSREDRTPATPVDRPQHLPRAHPPTSSFSGPSRPSVLREIVPPGSKPPAGLAPRSTPAQTAAAATSKRQDDLRADAVWAEMQRTLADVELSAMNSSHVFGPTHAKALEDLRSAQLGLAQAWAKSEADDMMDEEFGRDETQTGAVGQRQSGLFGGNEGPEHKSGARHSRHGSAASGASGGYGDSKTRNMEEETERDIRLARSRREANDRYFKQVNRGVLDVVRQLDEVTTAMRRVEKESREIWNESSGSEDLGNVTDTDESIQQKGKREVEKTGRPRTTTNESAITMATDTDLLSTSPESRR